MIRRLLVANRGEIAVRVIHACRELGITSVAVYSDADVDALHVRLADEAYHLGPASARQSYLNIPNLMNVVTEAKVDAVHPGYGFLSENAAFASVCDVWGVTFVGPKASSIERMGVKVAARQTMAVSGVPIVPGSDGTVADAETACAIAKDIGYPVLVKASAGGGGRGIRVANNDEELRANFERAAAEAEASFGSGDLYLEKFLVDPRHIEIQVLADRHGGAIHLGERESSIQRRRQKLIEEAPSVALSPELRARMGEAAVRAARAVDYESAGTIEFLLDKDGKFYFIEMNTRIQVEHAVTEMITGIDIVKEQIRIAGGEPLSVRQEDIVPRGWALECRINAEDPTQDFRPSPGTITAYEPPGGPGVRVDSGVTTGSQVSSFYDSMVAKVICWGADRNEALARMRRALHQFRIEGVQTTIPLHAQLLGDEKFCEGDIHINFLERWLSRSEP